MGRRRVIVLLILTCILLVTLDQRGNTVIDRSRSVFSLILEPFDTASRTISRPVINAWRGISKYDDLVRENEALRAEIENQRGLEIQQRASVLEYQDLLALNQLLGTSSYPSTTARVIGGRSSNFQYNIQIDKGSNDGIQAGMPVVNGGGLVGTISEVFPNRALVLLAIDPEFAITVKILSESEPSRLPTRPNRPTEQGVDVSSTTSTTTTTLPPGETTTTLSPSVDPLAPVPGPTTTLAPVSEPGTDTTTVEVLRETGALRGQGADQLPIVDLVDGVDVGSAVQTAGGATSVAPPGIPVGTVRSVRTQSGSSAPLVEVELSAGDLTNLSFVRVLRYVPNLSGV